MKMNTIYPGMMPDSSFFIFLYFIRKTEPSDVYEKNITNPFLFCHDPIGNGSNRKSRSRSRLALRDG